MPDRQTTEYRATHTQLVYSIKFKLSHAIICKDLNYKFLTELLIDNMCRDVVDCSVRVAVSPI